MIGKKQIGSVLLSLLAICTVQAQDKKYTIEEATNGIYTTLAPEGLKSTSWEPGTNKLYHVVKTEEEQYWVSINFPSEVIDTVLTLSALNKSYKREQDFNSLPYLHWLSGGLVWMRDGTDLVQGFVSDGGVIWSKWVSVPKNAANITVDEFQNVAYTVDNNLFMIDRDRTTRQVTNDDNEHVINGQAVHRVEFGISGGIFQSPQGNYLAYYRMDETMVADYPVVDWAETPAKTKMVKYPMAGQTSHEVQLLVYNPETGKSVKMQVEGPKDQYLTCVTWGPNERYIYIAVLNRDQDHLWLNQYDASTGTFVKTLFEETYEHYVEPQHSLTFLPNEKDKFIWWSQRDGYMHLYLYNTQGKLIRQLTKGDWLVNSIDAINEQDKKLIISTTKVSPLEKHIYSLDWRNGKMERITMESGWHSVEINSNGEYILDEYNNTDVPKRTLVRRIDGRYAVELKTAADPLKDYDRPEIKSINLKAEDGTDLYGRLILPTDFSPNKKYPVIVYLYNGPHVQLIRNSFPASGNLWYEYLAQRGYVVFTMDGRGSSNRGLAFEQATWGHLGTVEMEDQLKGVEFLKSLPYVDADRMGVHGWSFGGFMTTSLMLRHPGVFKVGVAGGPVIDWKMYEIMYTERYMDTPEQNPEGYEEANLLTKVDNLDGKLLLIHGAQDDVVVWQHSMKLIRESVKTGKQIDYFVYPAHPHNVRGKDRVHLMQKITDYFDTHLK